MRPCIRARRAYIPALLIGLAPAVSSRPLNGDLPIPPTAPRGTPCPVVSPSPFPATFAPLPTAATGTQPPSSRIQRATLTRVNYT
ncbi:hypothetical protein C8Q78DRAFT_1034562 [Trametes maxima]|nr:hypothetical protein C8Q78DRAFT_1034562 [Trametes maxima]